MSDTQATALVQERDSDQFARVELTVGAAVPHVISSLNVAATPRPANFPIPRLTADEAINGIQKVLSEALRTGSAARFSSRRTARCSSAAPTAWRTANEGSRAPSLPGSGSGQ